MFWKAKKTCQNEKNFAFLLAQNDLKRKIFDENQRFLYHFQNRGLLLSGRSGVRIASGTPKKGCASTPFCVSEDERTPFPFASNGIRSKTEQTFCAEHRARSCVPNCIKNARPAVGRFLYLLLYAFVFIIKPIIRAGARSPRKKIRKVVLIKVHRANIGFKLLVVIVKHTAFAICGGFFVLCWHQFFSNCSCSWILSLAYRYAPL